MELIFECELYVCLCIMYACMHVYICIVVYMYTHMCIYVCIHSAWGKELDRISKFQLLLVQLHRKFSQTLDMFSITYPKVIRSENLSAIEQKYFR